MRTNRKRILFLPIVLMAVSVCLGAEGSSVSPEDLLDALSQPPKTAYHGQLEVKGRRDGETLSENVDIFFSPPNQYRWDFQDSQGNLFRSVVSDGEDEYVRSSRVKKVLKGGAIRSADKLLPPNEERALLGRNYVATLSTPEKVAGRDVWVLVLTPRDSGKPGQRFWIDQDNRLPLKVERSSADDRYRITSFFTSFDPAWVPKDDFFKFADHEKEIKEHELYPDFLSMEEINKNTGNNWTPAKELPEGFVFESADYYGSGKTQILHWRYTDGLTVISLFRTDKPVSSPKGKAGGLVSQEPSGDFVHLSGTIHSYSWKKGSYHYTLMGDLSFQSLKKMSGQFH